MKKYIAFVLALLLVISAYSFVSYAEDEESKGKTVIAIDVKDTVIPYFEFHGGFSDRYYAPDYTVYFSDGTSTKSENGCFFYGGTGVYYNYLYRLQYDIPEDFKPEVGKTYKVTASYKNVSDTFNLTVVESYIKSFEISDITIIEKCSDTDKNNYYSEYRYYPEFTLTFNNGHKQTFNYEDGFTCPYEYYKYASGDARNGFYPTFTDNQSTEHWEVGNTYEVSAEFLGFTDTFNVTIAPNPVKEITLGKIETYNLNSFNGNYNVTYINENNQLEYSAGSIPTFVHLYDGSVLETTDRSIYGDRTVYIYGQPYGIHFEVPYSNIILPLGKSNGKIEMTAFNKSYFAEYTANVKDGKDIIAGLEIDDITYIKDSGYYCVNPSYTVYLNDGREIHTTATDNGLNHTVIIDGLRYYINIDISEDIENWQIGESHICKGYISDYEDTFTVTVIDNPVKGIKNKTVYCNTFEQAGIFDTNTKSFEYGNTPLFRNHSIIKLELIDGSTVTVNNDGIFEIDNNNYYATYLSNQNGNPYIQRETKEYQFVFSNITDSFNVVFITTQTGDINNDKVINSADALYALQHSVGITTLNDEAAFIADVDENGTINSADALKMLQYSVGQIDTF